MLKYSLPALVMGFVLDLLIGDPRWLYHPICVIGNLIALLEKGIRRIFPKSHGGELAGGFVTVVLICLFSGGVPFLVLHYLYRFSTVADLYWKLSGVTSFLPTTLTSSYEQLLAVTENIGSRYKEATGAKIRGI